LSTPFLLHLPPALYAEMVDHARAELPNECCGLLAGYREGTPPAAGAAPGGSGGSRAVGRVVRRYPLINAAHSPTEYLSEPRSMFEAVRDIRRRGLDILAVYHSHPTSDPVPSRTDLERNFSEEVVHFIISLKGPEPALRAWWLTALDFREAEWEYSG
jgi:proteasome lid subunit RPN8/RPN11